MFPHLTTLWHRFFQRRVRIQTLTVAAEAKSPSSLQLSLFKDPPFSEQNWCSRAKRLAFALDQVRTRLGMRAVWSDRKKIYPSAPRTPKRVRMKANPNTRRLPRQKTLY